MPPCCTAEGDEVVGGRLQDLNFLMDVVDGKLGLVSGTKIYRIQGPVSYHATYTNYDEDKLLAFSKNVRTWGPFWKRNDLARITVTIRPRGETQLLVRASAQHNLTPVEDPLPYQKFFRTLEQALFLSGHQVR